MPGPWWSLRVEVPGDDQGRAPEASAVPAEDGGAGGGVPVSVKIKTNPYPFGETPPGFTWQLDDGTWVVQGNFGARVVLADNVAMGALVECVSCGHPRMLHRDGGRDGAMCRVALRKRDGGGTCLCMAFDVPLVVAPARGGDDDFGVGIKAELRALLGK